MRRPKMISARCAELLSYLQGCGPVGEWVMPVARHMSGDLGIAKTQLCIQVNKLREQGFIETQWLENECGTLEITRFRQYRVLIRLETPWVKERAPIYRTAAQKKMMSNLKRKRHTKLYKSVKGC
jgi:hypothetical protein